MASITASRNLVLHAQPQRTQTETEFEISNQFLQSSQASQLEMESRKRPYAEEDDEPSQTKKRFMTGSNGKSHVNGVVTEAEELTDGDNLELFRKEAIFRRMKHYSREHERSQARIAELERRKSTCEAGLAAISACWTQLVDAIRLLARPDDLPPVDVTTTVLFDLTTHMSDGPALTALEDKMDATKNLVAKFVQLGGASQSALHNETYTKCQKVQTECTALRSQMDVMRVKLHDSESQRDKLHDALVTAEIRADRSQSATVVKMQTRAPAGDEEKKEEKIEEPERKPSSPARSPSQENGTPESDEWYAIAQARESKILELERENAVLRDEKNILTLEQQSPSLEHVSDSVHYKILMEHASRLENTVKESLEQTSALRMENEKLLSGRKEYEDSVNISAAQATQELKSLLAKRDAENLRLRDQREQQASELNERKHKENVKMASLHELKVLGESRSERIVVLESELTRYKTQLAAHAGNEDLMAFFFRGQPEEVSYIEDLRSRLTAAENRTAALEQSLSIFQDEHPNVVDHMKTEAEAREQLAVATKQLDIYMSVYGEPSALAPDVQKLSDQLQKKEAEVHRLRMLVTQRAQAETSLYAELDKLSAAWEALDRQVKDKIFDLIVMEERLTKSALDKAKSENKFYAGMRDKEAIETERKNLSRNLEKQAKAVERLVDSEKNLTAQVGDLEKEQVMWKKLSEMHRAKSDALEHEVGEWKSRAEGEKKRIAELHAMLQEQEKSIDKKRASFRKAEEEHLRSAKEVDRQLSKLKVVSTGTASQKEAALQEEIDKFMAILKCSTCKMQMRNTVILKCMHSFCKQCVDTRILTRQRKCPACNIAFSQSDVQQLYFQ